jgi:hypothetical protein
MTKSTYKCPTCRECLDMYTLSDGNIYLYCWLCNKTFKLLPGRQLSLVQEDILKGVKENDGTGT